MFLRYVLFQLSVDILCTQNNTFYANLLPVSVSPLLATTTVHKKSNRVHLFTIIPFIFALWLWQIVTSQFLNCTPPNIFTAQYIPPPLHCHCQYPTAEMPVVPYSAVFSTLVSRAGERWARKWRAGRHTAGQGG